MFFYCIKEKVLGKMYQHFARYKCEKCAYWATLPLYPADGSFFLDPIKMYCPETDQIIRVLMQGKIRKASCIEEKTVRNAS